MNVRDAAIRLRTHRDRLEDLAVALEAGTDPAAVALQIAKNAARLSALAGEVATADTGAARTVVIGGDQTGTITMGDVRG